MRRYFAVTILVLGLCSLAVPSATHAQPAPDIKTVIETYKQALGI